MMVAAPKGKVIIRDRGWDKLKAELAGLKNSGVKVGILEAAGQEEVEGTTIAQIADYNEFGAPRAGIPERSFIRAALDENAVRVRDTQDQVLGAVIDRKLTPQAGLAVLGEFAKGLIQQKITRGPFVPNAPSTIIAKGSSRPLIDTGHLRRAVDYEIVHRGGRGK